MRVAALLPVLSALLLAGSPAQAGFLVTKLADTHDGVCDADCSLREAVVAANATPGPDEITLPAGTYVLTRVGAGEDAAATGDLDVSDGLTIFGAGSGSTVIDGNASDRVFDFREGGGAVFSLLKLTVRNGHTSEAGGGIRCVDFGAGSLELRKVVVEGNEARDGGGLSIGECTASVEKSVLRDNVATMSGGGLRAFGSSFWLTLVDTEVEGNSAGLVGGGIASTAAGGFFSFLRGAVQGNAASSGGGLYMGDEVRSELRQVTVQGNAASGPGGGVYISEGSSLIEECRIVGNHAGGEGGGVYTSDGTGGTDVIATEIASNTSDDGVAGIWTGEHRTDLVNVTVSGNAGGTGGALRLGDASDFFAGPLSVVHSTIVGNTNGAGPGGILLESLNHFFEIGGSLVAENPGGDCEEVSFGFPSTNGWNLIGDGDGCAFFGPDDLVGTGASSIDPLLGPLRFNGGSTRTHAVAPDSPALDSVPGAACAVAVDQRGVARPFDGDDDGALDCDAGAFERSLADEGKAVACGLGAELALLLPVLLGVRRGGPRRG